MSDDSDKDDGADGSAKQIIDSTTALVKAVPIYEDAIQPVAKETGKALGTIGKLSLIHISEPTRPY